MRGNNRAEKLENFRIVLKAFMNDDEFWVGGGIPEKESYYIKKYELTGDDIDAIYTALCSFHHVAER